MASCCWRWAINSFIITDCNPTPSDGRHGRNLTGVDKLAVEGVDGPVVAEGVPSSAVEGVDGRVVAEGVPSSAGGSPTAMTSARGFPDFV